MSARWPPSLGLEALITGDYLDRRGGPSTDLQPELVLGTQMERHIAKRLGIPCAVISTPAHVQDYPARYSPQMGFRGCNRHVSTRGCILSLWGSKSIFSRCSETILNSMTVPSLAFGGRGWHQQAS